MRLSWLTWWVLNLVMCPYKRGSLLEGVRQRSHVKMEAEVDRRGHEPRMPGPAGAERGKKDPAQSLRREPGPARSWISARRYQPRTSGLQICEKINRML